MQLLTIPTTEEALRGTAPHWLRHMPAIAERAKVPAAVLIEEVTHGTTQLHMAWDGDTCHAVAGTRIRSEGPNRYVELCWCTGEGMPLWFDLIDDLERWAAQHLGIYDVRPVCREGWRKLLKRKGYRVVHVIMRKELPRA